MLRNPLRVFIYIMFVIQLCIVNVAQVRAQTSTPTLPAQLATSTPSTDERVSSLETQISDLAKKIDNPPKDIWDILEAISGLITGGLVAVALFFATQFYKNRQDKVQQQHNEQELKIARIETVQGFMEYLKSDDKRSVAGAIKSISVLDNDLAIELAKTFGSEGGVSALIDLAVVPNSEKAHQANVALKVIFQNLQKSVVLISGSQNISEVTGVGFLVSSGYVLTMSHVIYAITEHLKKDEIYVLTLEGRCFLSTKVDSNDPKDLALLKVENSDLPVLHIAKDHNAEFLDDIYAIIPDRLGGLSWRTVYGKVTQLYVSNNGREYIVTDLPADTGSGGAPVVNRFGEVIGVTAMLYLRDGKPTDTLVLPSNHISDYIKQHFQNKGLA